MKQILTSISLLCLLTLTASCAYAKEREVGTEMDLSSKPSLNFEINSADIEMVADTKSGGIHAQYDESVYDVSIERDNNNYMIKVSSKKDNNVGKKPVRIFIPDIAYGNVDFQVSSASFTCNVIKSADITGSFETSSVEFTMPKEFTGSFIADVTGGNFQFESVDGYADSDVEIVCGKNTTVNAPSKFDYERGAYIYSNGTKTNVIKVNVYDYGYYEFN